ncbi:MAG: hypothetical protein ACHQLQ_00320 [Candidatus Acidiferrales bacterium]
MVIPLRLLRLIIEIIFVLLGALVVWLGVTGHIFFDRRKISWLAVSAALILWGLRTLYKPNKWWTRWENWTRGLSLTLLGLVMVAISRAQFAWVGPLLAAGGVLLMLRGIIGFALVVRPRREVSR